MTLPIPSTQPLALWGMTLLGNVVEIKNLVPTNQDPKIIQERWHYSPTVAAEEELVERVEVDLVMRLTIRPTIYPTNESLDQFPRIDLRG